MRGSLGSVSLRVLGLGALAAAASAALAAQTPPPTAPAAKPTPAPAAMLAGTLECAKAEQTTMDVGDAPRHVLSLGRTPCRWTQAFKIGRLRTHSGESKMLRDERGELATVRGYHVGRMVNGDAYYFRFDGQDHSREGAPEGLRGRWAFTGGTGELAGLQGQGTYRGTFDEDGVARIEMEGEYRLP